MSTMPLPHTFTVAPSRVEHAEGHFAHSAQSGDRAEGDMLLFADLFQAGEDLFSFLDAENDVISINTIFHRYIPFLQSEYFQFRTGREASSTDRIHFPLFNRVTHQADLMT